MLVGVKPAPAVQALKRKDRLAVPVEGWPFFDVPGLHMPEDFVLLPLDESIGLRVACPLWGLVVVEMVIEKTCGQGSRFDQPLALAFVELAAAPRVGAFRSSEKTWWGDHQLPAS